MVFYSADLKIFKRPLNFQIVFDAFYLFVHKKRDRGTRTPELAIKRTALYFPRRSKFCTPEAVSQAIVSSQNQDSNERNWLKIPGLSKKHTHTHSYTSKPAREIIPARMNAAAAG